MVITEVVNEVFYSLEKNNFKTLGHEEWPMWDEPIVGVVAGDDPYYSFLKEHIGEFHWTPEEAFRMKYNDGEATKLSVLSIIFPQTEKTRVEQRKAIKIPSENWLVSRGEWEPLMEEFYEKLLHKLEQIGIRAVAVDAQKEWSLENKGPLGIASKWSHRHSAYAAGLGTFGLSNGFISQKGKAVRITSIIVEANLNVTSDEKKGIYDWCLYFSKGICGACIRRCPAHAITEKGHNKNTCKAYEENVEENYCSESIDTSNYIFGCGLCQVKVPCENRKP